MVIILKTRNITALHKTSKKNEKDNFRNKIFMEYVSNDKISMIKKKKTFRNFLSTKLWISQDKFVEGCL